jgi:hypothetical protein
MINNNWIVYKDGNEAIEKHIDSDHLLYAIEMGNLIKIGITNNIKNRLSTLNGIAKNYMCVSIGKVALSSAHKIIKRMNHICIIILVSIV